MKKRLLSFTLVLVLVFSLSSGVLAANYENLADELNAQELFLGTRDGYDLDSAPTRTHALVMLIRMLGEEEEALACTYSNPFTDVPSWADRYVAYGYEKNYTNGISSTLFGGESACTSQMYVTLVLRALGYSDAAGGDFTYAAALSFGIEVGLVDEYLAGAEFHRDELVAISYMGLALEPQNGNYSTLLEKLIADGAVDAEKAAPTLAKIKAYAGLEDALIKFHDNNGFAYDVTETYAFTYEGGTYSSMTYQEAKLANMDDGLEMSVLTSTDDEDGTVKADYYYVDGYYYENAEGVKSKIACSEEDLIDVPYFTETQIYYLYDTTEVTAETRTNGDTYYTVVYNTDMLKAFSDGEVSYDEYSAVFCVNSSGDLVDVNTLVSYSRWGEVEGQNIYYDESYQIYIKMTSIGDKVSADLPTDLSSYFEIS